LTVLLNSFRTECESLFPADGTPAFSLAQQRCGDKFTAFEPTLQVPDFFTGETRGEGMGGVPLYFDPAIAILNHQERAGIRAIQRTGRYGFHHLHSNMAVMGGGDAVPPPS
jgi:hypothetical protein